MTFRAPAALALALAALSLGGVARADASAEERSGLEARLAELRREPESARRRAGEARLLHFLAQAAPEGDARTRLHEEGLRLAKRALDLDRDDPAAILWWTAHRGSQASPTRPLQAIAIANEIEEALLRLRALDPDHEFAAADRVLGHLYQAAPPVVSIGSMKKAERHLRDALGRFPGYPGNQLLWVELLVKKGDCEPARRGLAVVAASRELTRNDLEGPGWRRQAAALRDRVASCR